MDSGQPYDVVIIGGGLAGTTVAAQLALLAPPGFRALLIEPGEPGPGSAYAPSSERLYMNGPAMAMSAVPGDKQHLVRWLRTEPDHTLISRSLFGRYLTERFREAVARRPGFAVARAAVVDAVQGDGRFVLRDHAGTERSARSVVLALGNFPPDDSFLPAAMREHPGFVNDPWRYDPAFEDGNDSDEVLIVGSGLTAMDAIALLDERGFRGRVHLVSRHGLLPCIENPLATALDPKMLALRAGTPLALLASLRKAAKRHVDAGGDWRDVVESIRSMSPAIWSAWPLHERSRFLRHLQAFWAVHRYRVPPETDAIYRRLDGAGRIVRHRGRVVGARASGPSLLQVDISGPTAPVAVTVSSAINCTGPNGDYARVRNPLVANLLRRGVLRPDPLHLGLDATTDLRVVDRHGRPNDRLYALGPPLRGLYYETTAVPETREQAARIAHSLVAEFAASRLGAAS